MASAENMKEYEPSLVVKRSDSRFGMSTRGRMPPRVMPRVATRRALLASPAKLSFSRACFSMGSRAAPRLMLNWRQVPNDRLKITQDRRLRGRRRGGPLRSHSSWNELAPQSLQQRPTRKKQ